MPEFLTSAVFAGTVIWLLCRVFRQFGRHETMRLETGSADLLFPTVAVIVPVRDEAANIAGCLRGLIAQTYPRSKIEIIAVDDNSSDDTAAIVRESAARDNRVRLLQAGALPPGWAGKPHACWIGALATGAEWLCFVDADTAAEPELLRSAFRTSRERQLDLLSLSPFQQLTHFFDRLMIPLGFLAIAASMGHGRANRSVETPVSVNGQFMLMRAEPYFGVGGHAAVRDQICEDAALAGLMRASGLRVCLLGGETLIKVRMYRTARDLWEGFSKNVTQTFGGPTWTSIIAMCSLVIGWSVPLMPAWTIAEAMQRPYAAEIAAALIAMSTSLAVISIQIALARHFRIPSWYGLLFPLGCSIGALLAFNGIVRGARGRVRWKARSYAAKSRAGRIEIEQSTRPGPNDL